MNISNWNIWVNLAFTTRSFHKNFDLISDNENFITECEGTISEIRIEEHKLPRIIGEYRLSIWNTGLGISFNTDFKKLIEEYSFDDAYSEMNNIINNNQFHINYYRKIIFIHSIVLMEEYRKHEITEEFIETIFREYHAKNTAIIALVKPIQNNINEYDTYSKCKTILIKEYYHSLDNEVVPAVKYFSLNKLNQKKDIELNNYKLFSKATDCGFKRIENSHLFVFSPEKIKKRMQMKYDELKTHNLK